MPAGKATGAQQPLVPRDHTSPRFTDPMQAQIECLWKLWAKLFAPNHVTAHQRPYGASMPLNRSKFGLGSTKNGVI